jgi:hypothetical protein
MPDTKQEYDYSGMSFDTPSTSSEVNSILSRSSSDRRPKLRSIVISRAANGDGKYPESSGSSSHDRLQKSLIKKSQSHRQDIALKKVKDDPSAGPSTSGSSHLHHKDRSYLSQSAHRYEGSSRYSTKSDGNTKVKHNKKDEKKKKHKRRIDSDSSVEREECWLKPKKRKRIVSLFTDSSDD